MLFDIIQRIRALNSEMCFGSFIGHLYLQDLVLFDDNTQSFLEIQLTPVTLKHWGNNGWVM